MSNWLYRGIEGVERQYGRSKGYVPNKEWYQFRVTCTCPPSTSLYMRGGTECNYSMGSARDYRAYIVPDRTIDFLDADVLVSMHTSSTSLATDFPFTNAHYYKGFALILRSPTGTAVSEPNAADWTFWLVGEMDEFATAAEAEDAVELNGMWLHYPWTMGYPLCGVVLRNDGVLGSGRHILPIDIINRGRSYIWPSDIRPKWQTNI